MYDSKLQLTQQKVVFKDRSLQDNFLLRGHFLLDKIYYKTSGIF